MHCPFCQSPDSRVVDTRIADDGASIRRRRECTACKHRFTTLETSSFQVVKRSGVVEPFSRNKVVQGVMKACQGRPVNEHDLARLAQQVEEKLRTSGVINVSSDEVGKAILPFLAQLDEIAYLRFASVYLDFNDLDDFDEAITELRKRAKTTEATQVEGSASSGSTGSSRESTRPKDTAVSSQKKSTKRHSDSAGATAEQTASDASADAGTDSPASGMKKSKGRSKAAEVKRTQAAEKATGASTRKRRAPRKTTAADTMPSLLDS